MGSLYLRRTLGPLLAGILGSATIATDVWAQVPDTTTATARPARAGRRGFFGDRRFVPVGSIVTVVVDERSTARERTSKVASSGRQSSLGASAASADFALPFSSGSFNSDRNNQSRNVGETNRRGDLSSVFTVTVVGVDPSGALMIAGTRTLEIDGGKQEWELEGLIRPEDLDANNLIASNRIANATILYKGKAIGPDQSLISRILGIFWP